ncbi:DUF4352 domain-containing protein [Staphylococcus devriesei]|nr:DUF4352 domain-containing protein [Staphylococcus devriesei]
MKENYHHDQERRQWEQFQEYQKQQDEEKKKKHKKGWLFGCSGCLVLLILIVIGISACTTSMTGSLSDSNSSRSKTYNLGDTVKNGDLEVTVNSVENMQSVGPSIAPTNAKDTFVVADVTVKNKGDKSLTIDSNMFKLKSDNKTFDADAQGSMSANQSDDGNIENSFFLEQVNPDSTTQGKVVFDVSENVANTKSKKLEITSSLFSANKVTFDISQ